ncbi:MAG: DUF4105 domain-containing protein [Bacteroidota bacterium]
MGYPFYLSVYQEMMKRALIALILLGSFSLPTWAQPKQLSPNAEIYVMTIAAGAELYSAFGHTAIWVNDPNTRTSTIYNYGTFDFDPPGFYLDFTRGKLNYRLDIESFKRFQRIYRYYQRTYTGQRLHLTQDQIQRTYEFMEYNFLPAHRYYLYDFLYDNCATRVQDMMSYILQDSLDWGDSEAESELSFRDMLKPYLAERPWPDFGIALALGSAVDRKAKYREMDFLPDYLAIELGKAKVKDTTGQWVPLVDRETPFYEGVSAVPPTPFWTSPMALWWSLAIISFLLSGWELFRNRLFYGLNKGVFFVAGLMGFILFLAWFATEHSVTEWNYNLLWLWPTHIVTAWWISPRAKSWLKYYYLFAGVLPLLLLAGWNFLPQALHPTFIPMMLILSTRGLGLFYKMNRGLV